MKHAFPGSEVVSPVGGGAPPSHIDSDYVKLEPGSKPPHKSVIPSSSYIHTPPTTSKRVSPYPRDSASNSSDRSSYIAAEIIVATDHMDVDDEDDVSELSNLAESSQS